jgi:hypothetical protein
MRRTGLWLLLAVCGLNVGCVSATCICQCEIENDPTIIGDEQSAAIADTACGTIFEASVEVRAQDNATARCNSAGGGTGVVTFCTCNSQTVAACRTTDLLRLQPIPDARVPARR